MLAIGRALMSRPRILLLDEPSLGLSPILVQQIFSIIQEINARGMTILLVEQNALQALAIAHRGYVLQTGQVVLSGDVSRAARQRDGAQGLPRRGLTAADRQATPMEEPDREDARGRRADQPVRTDRPGRRRGARSPCRCC